MAVDWEPSEAPQRPIIDENGILTNPVGSQPWIELRFDQPVMYHDLLPNQTYVHKGFEYLTDSNSTPAQARGGLRLVEDPIRHHHAQLAAGRRAPNVEGRQHGGHLIAVSLGGFPSGPNLFPQMANFNQSSFARLERGWREALREGCTVELDIHMTVDESEDAWSPVVIATYWEDGEEWEIVLLNENHQFGP